GTPLATRLVVSGREDELTTNDDGLARIEVTPTGNRLELSVKATDAEGRTGRASFAHNVASPNTAFLLRPDKSVYDGGETMKLSIVGGGIEPVLIDLLKDGQAILSTTVAMQDGRGELAVDLPAELFGTLQLIAYRYGQRGLPVRQSRVIFVRPADELTVQATLDREVYEPGGKATVRFELRNEQGQPVAGALSVAAVDEAVFSVLGPQLGLERTFFELESELLQPVATVYPWSPFDAEQSPARTELTQALFARTVDIATGDQAVPGRFRDGQAKGVRSVDPLRDGGDAPIFTLVANTFPAKDRVTDIQRRRGLRWAAAAWRWSAAGFILACIGIFAAYRPRLFAIIASVALLLILPLGCMTWMFLRLDAQFDFAAGDMAITAEAANEEMPYPLTEDMAAGDESAQSGRPQPRVREWFPETLVWRPELVTDDNGVATLEIDPLADSITTWRLSASAISAGGRLGSLQQGIRVFQPFFVDVDLPVAFTRGDEVSMPIVVYNYLDEPQTVELALDAADWYERLDADDAQAQPLRIELAAGEVRSLHVPLRMLSVGQHRLTVTARGGETADAIRREVTIEPNGEPYESLSNGTLDSPFETTIQIPDNAVPGSAQVFAKFYPSTFSQLVEGLDGIFAQPHGCFEQTSSTTYPNVLALDYLRRTRQAAPEVEAQARQYIHLGYQRLLTFEVDGGGFDWFGNPPAHTQLTAYGLMEFEDMANVHDIDPTLIQRTRGWLLAMRNSDGSWPARRGLDEVGGDDTLANTAYIAWAVFGGDSSAASGSKASTLQYLLAHEPATLGNPYHLAVMANALQAIGAAPSVVNGYVERLLELSQTT
ncbi:MAG: hypothetical protein KDA62_15500, partial [Planctomycetales bacterium]|nr:hypothetical protein [Planctomycetales bacterium]